MNRYLKDLEEIMESMKTFIDDRLVREEKQNTQVVADNKDGSHKNCFPSSSGPLPRVKGEEFVLKSLIKENY